MKKLLKHHWGTAEGTMGGPCGNQTRHPTTVSRILVLERGMLWNFSRTLSISASKFLLKFYHLFPTVLVSVTIILVFRNGLWFWGAGPTDAE